MPLPWKDVNARESQAVAELIALPKRTRAERRKWGCPFCGSSDALHAYPGPGAGFSCWAACGASSANHCRGYSNVDVAAGHWNVRASDACRRLAMALGIVFDDDRRWPRRGSRREIPRAPASAPVQSRQEINLAAVRRLPAGRLPHVVYADLISRLELTARGRRYLAGRSLDPDRASEYGFRSIDDRDAWAHIAAHLAATYRPEELLAAGFPPAEEGAVPLTLPFAGRLPALLLPFWRSGDLIGVRFRNTLPNDPRFKHNRYRTLSAAKPLWPYNADALRSGTVHVCEGELNAETLRQLGENAIGVYGAGIWLDTWTRELAGCEEIVDWHDAGDPKGAGDHGAESLRRRLVATLGAPWVSHRWRRVLTEADPNDLHQGGKLAGVLHLRPWSHTQENLVQIP